MMRRGVLALLSVLLMLTGCAVVPTAGPVVKVEGQPPQCANCVNVDVEPPSAGQTPRQIVDGYLRAMSNFQPNYSVARQFLSQSAVDAWSPEASTKIYNGSPVASGNNVRLQGRLLGMLGADRSLTPLDQTLDFDFGLRQENGQWRISTPPNGLFVADYAFDNFYISYNLYFLSSDSLVPDPIYLPNLRNTAATASVLIRSLINGPSTWLRPAVSTALPAGTALSVDAVTISDGVAEIPLNDPVLAMNDVQRTQLAAQVVYTLKPLGIQGVRFTVNQQPVAIPGSDPDTNVLSVTSIGNDLDPVPLLSGDQLYAARTGGVDKISIGSDQSDAQPIPGPLGNTDYGIDAIAVSNNDTDLAVVTNGATMLRRATTAGDNPMTLLNGVSNLLRPQFTRYNEIWAVGREGGQAGGGAQRAWVFAGDARRSVDLSGLVPAGTIDAFRISPDGSRAAMIRTVNGRTQLGLARILRSSDKITVNGWRPLDVDRSDATRLSVLNDVTWVTATSLIVLAGTSAATPLMPYRVSQDGFTISAEGEASTWAATAVSVSLNSQTTVVRASDGQTWRNGGSQWIPLVDKVRAISFPG